MIASLHKIGISLRQLAFSHGLAENTLRSALSRPYPRAEALIAEALGLAPDAIWPERASARVRRRERAAQGKQQP